MPWDSEVSERYGLVHAKMENQGKTLAPFDLLIASHALSKNITLVANDQAFKQVPGLHIADWSLA